MSRTFGRAAIAVLALGVSVFAGSTASAASALYMRVGSVTSQPIGHYEFCQSHRDECQPVKPVAAPARVTDFGWNVIKEVNAEVNRRILPMTDEDIYGKDEVWAYPTDVGDCEDFVLEKRRELMQKGFSASNLLITVVRKPDGEGHAVLTVRTIDGDFILDNLDESVRLWSETPYRFMKRQADYDSGRWVKIENSPDTVLVGSVDN